MEFKGDEEMQTSAEQAYPLLKTMIAAFSPEQRLAIRELMKFWRSALSAGHKNMFMMVQSALAEVADESSGPKKK